MIIKYNLMLFDHQYFVYFKESKLKIIKILTIKL